MSTQTIFLIALLVFGLMGVGLIRTLREANRSSDEPLEKEGQPDK